MYYLYILKCADKTLYTGITTNLDRRIKEHNTSKFGAKYTSARRPVKLVYSKKFINRSRAQKEESRIKKLSRVEKLKMKNKFFYALLAMFLICLPFYAYAAPQGGAQPNAAIKVLASTMVTTEKEKIEILSEQIHAIKGKIIKILHYHSEVIRHKTG